MSRILLIQPPIEDFYFTPQRSQPTGLLYLASFLSGRGHTVEICDLLTPAKKTPIPPDPELGLSEDELRSDRTGLFRTYARFGADRKQTAAALKEKKFDLCGISANFAAYYRTALETAEIVREIRPSAFIVMGGHSVPVCSETYLSSGAVDAVVFGEGEETLCKIADRAAAESGLDGVENTAFRRDGRTVGPRREKNFSIASSSINLDFIDAKRYRIGRRRSLSLVASRGCPFSCAYCTANLNCLSGHQRMPVENLFRDIRTNVERHGIGALNIEDENFTFDRDYALGFLERKIREFPDLRLYFMNGLDYRFLDGALLEALRNADLHNLGLALVDMENSGALARPPEAEKLREIVARAKDLGFLVTVYFIAGLPGQTKESLVRLIGLLASWKAVIGMSVYYAVPGTPLFESRKDRFKDFPFARMRSTALTTGSDTVSRADLIDLFSLVREKNRAL